MQRLLTFAFLTMLVAGPIFGADVHLILDETTILPGTPTGMTISVTNTGKSALNLASTLWLVAVDEEAIAFRVAAYGMSDTAGIQLTAAERIVPAGATREFRFDPSAVLAGSPWFTDGSLSRPGRYRLRAVFAPQVEADGDFNAAHAVVSSEELLTVEVAAAEDAHVWEWMRTRGRGRWGQNQWLSEPFADFVISQHPTSSYALYAAVFLPREETAPNPALAAQAARFPNKSYAEQLRLLLVQYHQQASDILRHSDVKAAAEQLDAARKLAEELASSSRIGSVRATARQLLNALPKRDMAEAQIR